MKAYGRSRMCLPGFILSSYNMDKTYFQELTAYIIETNRIICGWLEQLDNNQWKQTITSSFDSIEKTTIHLVSAQLVWIDYWSNNPEPVFLSTVFKGGKAELLTIWRQSSTLLKMVIDRYPEADYSDNVRIKWGADFYELKFWQTFAHFVNHSTYHRGQLVTMLRTAGFRSLSSTDLFNYFLQRGNYG